FKVSGGIVLNTFADKVLMPIMGWVWNFHGYVFIDHKDGCLFGPKGSDITCHLARSYYYYMDDKEYKLGDLLTEKGARLGWLYDLGDGWRHEVEVEDIRSVSESTGTCKLLDGAGRCPPENGRGNWEYHETINVLKNKRSRQCGSALDECRNAPNIKPRPFTSRLSIHLLRLLYSSLIRFFSPQILKNKRSRRYQSALDECSNAPNVKPRPFTSLLSIHYFPPSLQHPNPLLFARFFSPQILKNKQSRQYQSALEECSNAPNCKPRTFDFREFDLAERRRELKHALASPGSTQSGSKLYTHTMHPFDWEDVGPPRPREKKGEKRVEREGADIFSPTLTETISTKADKVALSLCADCGRPEALYRCGRCRVVRYCSRECQSRHWKESHKQACKTKK
ncbi:hypothetical protein KFL_004020010, partial [Klebsormidium nitens]